MTTRALDAIAKAKAAVRRSYVGRKDERDKNHDGYVDGQKPRGARPRRTQARQANRGQVSTYHFGDKSGPATLTKLDPSRVGFDPETFQYKRYEGEQGSTGTLSGVGSWDQVASGKLIVFQRRNGSYVVADGHQRLALAKRLKGEGKAVQLDAYVFKQADGWTARDVRHIAAKKNLMEGAGDPLDVAAILREKPDLLDKSMPLGGHLIRTGKALADLDDKALGAVRNGLISPETGAAIGRAAGDRPDIHMALVDHFAKRPPRTAREAEFIAAEAKKASTRRADEAQDSLFGDDPVLTSAHDRALVLENAIRILRDDKRAFSAAERFADDLEGAGNVLARSENQRRKEGAAILLEHIRNLATRAGPVSDALTLAATDADHVKGGKAFANAVIRMLRADQLDLPKGDQAPKKTRRTRVKKAISEAWFSIEKARKSLGMPAKLEAERQAATQKPKALRARAAIAKARRLIEAA